jgi:hypothetical protein
MKNILPLIIAALLLSSLSGCLLSGSGTPTDFAQSTGISMEPSKNEINACFQWMKEKESADRALILSLPADQRQYAQMHHDTMDMIKTVWGKESNVCKPGTNGWDAYIVAKKEEEITKRQYSSDLKSVATFGIVTTGAVKLTDSIMGKVGDNINNSGDHATVTKHEEDNDNVAIANDKSQADVAKADSKKESTGCGIEPAHLSDCRTTANGPATADEYNACLTKDYGYPADKIAGCPQ